MKASAATLTLGKRRNFLRYAYKAADAHGLPRDSDDKWHLM